MVHPILIFIFPCYDAKNYANFADLRVFQYYNIILYISTIKVFVLHCIRDIGT